MKRRTCQTVPTRGARARSLSRGSHQRHRSHQGAINKALIGLKGGSRWTETKQENGFGTNIVRNRSLGKQEEQVLGPGDGAEPGTAGQCPQNRDRTHKIW